MVAQASSSATARNKLVIRRLPPTLPEEIFWKSVSAWIDDKTCLWKRYIKGKVGDGTYDIHPVHSRAYVLMASPEALVEFVRGFDGHVFKAKTGAEYRAVVEFASVQKTPYKAKVKVDARQGTIDDDPDYLSYLESLKAEPVKPVLEVSAPITQPTSTPLLDHLRTQGKSKKSKSSKSAASSSSANESARRAAALASVTAAASKRAGQAGSGPVMVAGKGREVHIATPAPASETKPAGTSAQGDGENNKKKGRNRKKGKKDGESAAGENPSNGNTKQPPSDQRQSTQNTPKNHAAASKPASSQGTKQDGGRSKPSNEPKNPDGHSGPKSDRPNKGGRGGGTADGTAGGKSGEANGNAAEGGGRGGGGGGRGGRGKDRSGKAQVMEILTRNSAGGAGAPARGGRGGAAATAGTGRGGPVQSEVGASRARIDVP